jgi:hypothetical protein
MQAPARRSPIRCIAVVEFRYLGLGTCTVETVKFWSRDPTYRTVPYLFPVANSCVVFAMRGQLGGGGVLRY